MESAEVYRERLDTLTKRRAVVEAQRDTLLRERAALIKAGKDTGDTWLRVQGCEQELQALSRELNEVGNFASDAFVAERIKSERAEFNAANRSLSGKRGQLAAQRDAAVAAVNAAADKLMAYVQELDVMERGQAAKAAELNQLAETVGVPGGFVLPDNREPYTGQGFSRPDAKTFADSRVLLTASKPDRKAFLTALAEAAYAHSI